MFFFDEADLTNSCCYVSENGRVLYALLYNITYMRSGYELHNVKAVDNNIIVLHFTYLFSGLPLSV